ncbi:MucR family transcriptional regulator [Azospirillum oleiclasticum]|nr:MucR family transcriptional regulator [Azospirillum oleiclasticum]
MKPDLIAEYLAHLARIELVLAEVFQEPAASAAVARLDDYFRSLPEGGMFDVLHHDAYDMAVEWGGPDVAARATDDAWERYEALMDGAAWRAIRALRPAPAVPVEDSVTPTYIVCLEDGKQVQDLKRYLGRFRITPEEYRVRWNLPADYPMTVSIEHALRQFRARRSPPASGGPQLKRG